MSDEHGPMARAMMAVAAGLNLRVATGRMPTHDDVLALADAAAAEEHLGAADVERVKVAAGNLLAVAVQIAALSEAVELMRPVVAAADALCDQPALRRGEATTWADVERSRVEGPRLLRDLMVRVDAYRAATGKK